MIFIRHRHILLGIRGGQDNHWQGSQGLIAFDFFQDIKSVHFGQAQIKQYQVRHGELHAIGIRALPMKVIKRRLTIFDMVDGISHLKILHVAYYQLGVVAVVLYQQNCQRFSVHCGASFIVKQNRLPIPSPSDSTQTRPPCTSMIRLTSASPTPVPSLSASSLLNRPKMS